LTPKKLTKEVISASDGWQLESDFPGPSWDCPRRIIAANPRHRACVVPIEVGMMPLSKSEAMIDRWTEARRRVFVVGGNDRSFERRTPSRKFASRSASPLRRECDALDELPEGCETRRTRQELSRCYSLMAGIGCWQLLARQGLQIRLAASERSIRDPSDKFLRAARTPDVVPYHSFGGIPNFAPS
jgi:hypothetical protein